MKTQEQLFNEWKELGHSVAELGCIVQNPLSDLLLDLNTVEEWVNEAHQVLERFSTLLKQTRDIILSETKH